jgi:hypothetical protein
MARQLQRLLLQATERPSTKLRKRVFFPASIASHCSIVGRTSDMPPSTGAHATPAGWQQLDQARIHLSCAPAPDGWAGRLPAAVPSSEMGRRLSQRAASTPHRPAGGCLRVHGQVEQADVLHSRPQPRGRRLRWPGEPLKRRERTQNDIAKTAAAKQTLQDAVDARAYDEKYCDYRQEDWAAFRSRVDAAQLCVARYDNLHSTTFKAWVAARGVLCWVGASLAGRCFVAGGFCVGMLVRVLLTCFFPGNVCAVRVCRSFQDTFKVVIRAL